MVLTGAIARPSASTCFRCQLRAALSRHTSTTTATTSRQSCNGFTAHARGRQEGDRRSGEKRPLIQRHFYPNGRVVGQGVKRQRVTSEKLTRNSLDKPSSVVILRDVRKETCPSTQPSKDVDHAEPPPKHARLSAKDIERSIMGKYQAPDADEVNASIASLRPDSPILDGKEFEELVRKLSNSYTSPQLSRYLFATLKADRSVSGKAVGKTVHSQSHLSWVPGRTPLALRHVLKPATTGLGKKHTTIEQIVRLCWNIAVQSEEQEVGELEMQLEPWQLSMLFDLSENDKPYYQSLIRTQMLIDTTEVQPYRPDAVVRVTGRRVDAEDTAWQLKSALMDVQPLRMHLAKLLPRINDQAENIFSDEELAYVSNLTKSVILLEPGGIVAIYNKTVEGRNHARRLLLSLPRASVSSGEGILRLPRESAEADTQLDIFRVPIQPSAAGLHRWAGRDLFRSVQAVDRVSESARDQPQISKPISPDYLDKLATTISSKLDSIQRLAVKRETHSFHEESYWDLTSNYASALWKVRFCKHLEIAESATSAGSHAVCSNIPGTERLLSYFETIGTQPRPLQPSKDSVLSNYVGEEESPHKVDWSLPQLIANFIPMPSEDTTSPALPRVQLRYHFLRPTTTGKPKNIYLTGIKADIDHQSLIVPLPDQSVDLEFTRTTPLIDRDVARLDKHINYFTKQLQKSIFTGDGVLSAPPGLIFRLPRWLVHSKQEEPSIAESGEDAAVTYLFERFSQVQKLTFTPSENARALPDVDAEVRDFLEQFPAALRLDYREVDGGAIHGNHTSLTLVSKPHNPARATSKSRESGASTDAGRMEEESNAAGDVRHSDHSQKLAATALRIAHLLTRANAGTLSALEYSRG